VGLDGKGLEAVAVTEFAEPQPVIGSYLHSLVFPDDYSRHQEGGSELRESHHHPARGRVRSLQLRGEYLFAALGKGGFRVFDVANIDNKDSSERFVTAPVSGLGQRTYVKTSDATAVALPTTMPVAPWRTNSASYPENQEQPMHPIYRFAFVSDRHEGLVVVNVDTLTDGDPTNNFFERATIYGESSYNPEQALDGATNLVVAGNYVYVASAVGVVVVDFGDIDPLTLELRPRIAAVIEGIDRPTALAVQFRYLFVTGAEGLSVVEITDPTRPRLAAQLAIAEARNVYVARTYAYVAGGKEGVVIVDIERPEEPRIEQVYNAGGELDDTWDVKVASTSASLFAYVADGENGLRVLQLTSPDSVPGYLGFSPVPAPRLVATKHTHGPAVALSKGLDRDRAVDESGNQVSVFNRIGARPLNLEEMQRLYLRRGELYTVEDEPELSRSIVRAATAKVAERPVE
jgi:hypothetical protein